MLTLKYPWVALTLIIVWLSTTYIILRSSKGHLDVNYILLATFIGTIIVAYIGFRAPTFKK